ncbi:amino acid permease [Streptomyces sp. NPDC002209]|uniref:amino acid permease n=1 Tax=Streptomyces sp. NPDC002209 TaxID=3364638 RepID=UPI0036C57E6D
MKNLDEAAFDEVDVRVVPERQLPRAMYLALGIATVIYIAIALGVFGTLTVEEVVSSGGTALAVAAEPTLGQAGYWLMSVTALFATAGATNAGLYPAAGLSERLVDNGLFPPLMARKVGGRVTAGLLFEAAVCLVLAIAFKLEAIASIGSAVALLIFVLITIAHFRVRKETGANPAILVLAVAAAGGVLVTFIVTTLIHEPASIVTLLAILAISAGLDFGWHGRRGGRTGNSTTANGG